MKRKLDDTRVGEYKTNWCWTFFYTIMIVVGIVAIFLFPITYLNGEAISPINYFFKGNYNNFLGNCSFAYIVLVSILFINTFFSLSVARFGKSVMVKVNKIFEYFMALGCLCLHVVYLLFFTQSDFAMEGKYFFFWMSFLVIIMVFSLINYYETKKISIYD